MMDLIQNMYCYHCMAKIEDNNDEFCSKCGKKHSKHFCQSNELPAGAYLENGRYLVGKSIGSGGFGITYIGFDMKLEKKVLIKETFYYGIFKRNVHDPDIENPLDVLYGGDFSLEEIMSRTRKECIALSEGEGMKNIVKVYDWFTENNTAYIITEFIDGITLDEHIAKNGRYTWNEFYPKIKPLMTSLSVIHKKGIIHRDIKPQNIMIRTNEGFEEEFVLIDFGLARSTERKTLASVGAGFTPGYSPYEQRTISKNDGVYTDVYSLAATIYYALTGLDPNFEVAETVEGNFPEIKYMTEKYGVPKDVVQGLKFALNMNYKQRCQSIDVLMRFFDKVQLLNERKNANTPPPSQLNTIRNVEALRNAPPDSQLNNINRNVRTNPIPKTPQGNPPQTQFNNANRTVRTQDLREEQTAYAQQEEYYDLQDGYYDEQGEYLDRQNKYYEREGEYYDHQDEYYDEDEYEEVFLSDAEMQKEYDKILKDAKNIKTDSQKKQRKTVIKFIAALVVIGIISSIVYYISSRYFHVLKSILIVIITLCGMLSIIWKPLKQQRVYKQMTDLEFDAAVLNAFMQRAVEYYRAGQLEKTWNGRLSHEATIHDVCMENKTDDPRKYYSRKINRKTYNLVWTGEEVKMSVDNSLPLCLALHSNTLIKNAAEFHLPEDENGGGNKKSDDKKAKKHKKKK